MIIPLTLYPQRIIRMQILPRKRTTINTNHSNRDTAYLQAERP